MVSIPDWAKFSRLHDLQLKKSNSGSHLSRYYKQREEEAVRQAERQGYFINPSQDYILHHCAHANRKIKDIYDLQFVKLEGLHLRKVGEISYCANLQICILNNNFLSKIDGLAACRQLVKLDVHNNQLSSIPGMPFWSGLRKLKFLHLHDNPLGKFDTLQSLSACPKLIGLTLFDTPLSLRKNYRHHVVNSVWALKALDRHVVSDEEIIEDAVFGGKFTILAPAFKVDLCPQSLEDSTLSDELWTIHRVESCVNQILARNSPVLIIQRYFRGFLTRKRYSQAVQRQIRKAMQATSSELLPPPPSTPMNGAARSLQDLGPDGIPMDYDTYLQNRRPGSNIPSDITVASVQRMSQVESIKEYPSRSSEKATDPAGDPHRKKTNIFINLAKLQNGTFQNLQEEAAAIETIFSRELQDRPTPAESRRKSRRKKHEEHEKPRKVKSVKQFFGPMIDPCDSPDRPNRTLYDIEEDTPITHYRLRGKKPNILLVDATTEMIIERKEAGKHVRDAEMELHKKAMEIPQPKLLPQKHTTADQRIFSRVHGTMGMSCLFAVQKAYNDREKAEKANAKMEYILNMREERSRAKERINSYRDEKRNQALRKRDQDRAKMLDSLEKRELQRLNYIDKRQELKSKSNDVTKSYHADLRFVTDFNNQHTSVSNALLRHDRQAQTEDQLQSKSTFSQSQRKGEVEQQDTVKKFLEHRKLMRQSETATTKAALGTKLLQEANDRMMEAQQRVAQQKARRATVQAFYPLPPNNVPGATSSAPAGMTRWEATALIGEGRVGRHHTVVI